MGKTTCGCQVFIDGFGSLQCGIVHSTGKDRVDEHEGSKYCVNEGGRNLLTYPRIYLRMCRADKRGFEQPSLAALAWVAWAHTLWPGMPQAVKDKSTYYGHILDLAVESGVPSKPTPTLEKEYWLLLGTVSEKGNGRGGLKELASEVRRDRG